MKTTFAQSTALLLLAISAALSSCGIEHAVAPAKPTKFLTSTGTDTTARFSRLPFEHSWRAPEVNVTDYKNIIVRPVTTAYLHDENWERSKSAEIPDKKAFKKRSDALARHFTKQLNIAFSDPICIFYKTTDTSKPHTLILEVALTEAHFPDPAVKPLEVPYCGFEARVRDAKTGKLISTASDRRGPDLHLNENNPHITDNDEICSIWARQLMEASNREIFANVRRKFITVD
ncbi:DUF3313 family protein [Luteolibacter algae]|uniref:DUF3313 family protein n=1 Tax=Luteolibacter algae TaxID=454151 RepID=A0ABW5D9K8_9BACT